MVLLHMQGFTIFRGNAPTQQNPYSTTGCPSSKDFYLGCAATAQGHIILYTNIATRNRSRPYETPLLHCGICKSNGIQLQCWHHYNMQLTQCCLSTIGLVHSTGTLRMGRRVMDRAVSVGPDQDTECCVGTSGADDGSSTVVRRRKY